MVKQRQLSKLHFVKKLYDHRDSESHKAAFKILAARKQEELMESIAIQTANLHEETCNVFRTAYYIAKEDRPYSDHPTLIELQEMNGVNSGRVLHSNVVCTDIIHRVSKKNMPLHLRR